MVINESNVGAVKRGNCASFWIRREATENGDASKAATEPHWRTAETLDENLKGETCKQDRDTAELRHCGFPSLESLFHREEHLYSIARQGELTPQ